MVKISRPNFCQFLSINQSNGSYSYLMVFTANLQKSEKNISVNTNQKNRLISRVERLRIGFWRRDLQIDPGGIWFIKRINKI